MTKKTGVIILLFVIVCSMVLNAATREGVPPAQASEKSSVAAPEKDDSGSTAFFEQEGSEFENEPRLKVSWHVVAAAAVIIVAAIYFLVLKKPSTAAENTKIQVNSEPDAAGIILDGQDTGRLTNNTFFNVTPCQHNVKLTKSGYEDYSVSVWVVSGQTVVIDATLIKN